MTCFSQSFTMLFSHCYYLWMWVSNHLPLLRSLASRVEINMDFDRFNNLQPIYACWSWFSACQPNSAHQIQSEHTINKLGNFKTMPIQTFCFIGLCTISADIYILASNSFCFSKIKKKNLCFNLHGKCLRTINFITWGLMSRGTR